MRGVSAKSLDQVLQTVDRVVDGGADASQVGDELFAIVRVLDGAPHLRRTLTDPSTETAAEERLARSIFGERVSEPALEVFLAAVQRRWSVTRDMSDGIERAGVTAHIAGAEKDRSLDDLEDELFRFGRVVAGDHQLRAVVTDRSAPLEGKQQLVETLLAGKTTAAAMSLAKQAVAARARSFEATLDEFGDLAAARRERLLATVRAAYLLDDDEKQRLAAALGRQYGREVHVNLIVDESVIGGLSVEVGDDVIDGTVSSRLEDARRRIAG